MKIYRIQKYDPKLYDVENTFLGDEWTHVSQIGEIFSGKRLERGDYFEVENSYVKTINLIAEHFGVEEFTIISDNYDVREIENYKNYLFDISQGILSKYKNGIKISGAEMDDFIRLCLRDLQGYGLSNRKDLFFCFTGDYYVHVGCSAIPQELRRNIENLALHLVYIGEMGCRDMDNEYYEKMI